MNLSGTLSKTAQATLLLTSYFSKVNSGDAKPLTNAEWGRFAWWLKERSITPADLLTTDPKVLLNGWHDARIGAERLINLLNRGHSLALAMEKWQRAGLWVVTRADPEYPKRLKQRLKTDSPPVLFGCGNKSLLNAGGLAVVGSRNASDADLAFTDCVGAQAATESIAIVSGGARGVDETAMLGAMKQGGTVIGVLADSLLKAATSSKWRKGLMAGHVVLLSPYYPEAGFNTGNAMARNKYIYCLADSSLVIHSGKKGGTLSGAEENLKKLWVPLWVKSTTDADAANADLVSKGGRWYEENGQSSTVASLFEDGGLVGQANPVLIAKQPGLFSLNEPSPEEETEAFIASQPQGISEKTTAATEQSLGTVDFYQLFTHVLQQFAKEPVTVEQLLEHTGLNKSQLNDWLKRAEGDGYVNKLARPVRYQVPQK